MSEHTAPEPLQPATAPEPATPPSATTPLEDLLRRQIAADGPLSVADFMGLALGHPIHGYYTTRDPLGAGGDFVTAPEISQMFGELLGLWFAQTWIERGRPTPVTVLELGPGRGTLMADMLRAMAVVEDLRGALTVRLVETSPVLRRAQEETLADLPVTWHGTLAPALDASSGFLMARSNVFFDALPIRQFVRGAKGWHERMVVLDPEDRLAFGLAPDPTPLPPALQRAEDPEGTLREWGRAGEGLMAGLAQTIAARREGGAALVIDYGHARSGPGETLQAVRRHRFHPPLERPGDVDLTAHVDFEALGQAARSAGAAAHGPLTQGAFLGALGIEARAEALRRASQDQNASPDEAIGSALHRLTAPDAMGQLFKVLAVTDRGAPVPPAFPSPAAPKAEAPR